jgi:hypothetical protein
MGRNNIQLHVGDYVMETFCGRIIDIGRLSSIDTRDGGIGFCGKQIVILGMTEKISEEEYLQYVMER